MESSRPTELTAPERSATPARPQWIVAEKYRVIRPIGSGATGEVFEARHLVSGRDFALKVLHPKHTESQAEVFRDSFLREAAALAKLHHPHVVPILDYGTGEETWLALERVDGPSLADMLVDEPLAPREAITVARQLCAALAVAHDLGFVHRDIKPGNVLVAESSPLHVKLADFGLAKAWEDTDHVGENAVVGTPQFMAPEQIEDGVSSHRSDLYSVGVLLFQMLTGSTPFATFKGLSVLHAHVHREPPRLEDVAGKPFPSLLEDVVARCLEKDPTKRHACAADLDAELARCVVQLRHPDVVPGPFSRPSYDSEMAPYLDQLESLPGPVKPAAQALPRWMVAAVALLCVVSIVLVALVAFSGMTATTVDTKPAPGEQPTAEVEAIVSDPPGIPPGAAAMALPDALPTPEPTHDEGELVVPPPPPAAAASVKAPSRDVPPADDDEDEADNPFAPDEDLVNPFGGAP